MATVIRPELSKRNKYWISRHRYYELKHYCLQYNEWKKLYLAMTPSIQSPKFSRGEKLEKQNDPAGELAAKRADLALKMQLVEETAICTDRELYSYILAAVTEGRSYTYLKTVMSIPCSKDYFYERYRKFFWLLSKSR